MSHNNPLKDRPNFHAQVAVKASTVLHPAAMAVAGLEVAVVASLHRITADLLDPLFSPAHAGSLTAPFGE
jgi:hypothetical protein